MRKITKNQLIPLSLGVLIFSLLIVIYIFAWTEPPQAPPGGNVAVPVPTGAIVMWSGFLANIPAGWQLCNGTNGTPNLIDRFILGVLPGEDPGATGGGPTHSHTVDIWASLYSGSKLNCQNCGNREVIYDRADNNTWENWQGQTDDDYAGKREWTTNVNHLPPYYKLAFIMKL